MPHDIHPIDIGAKTEANAHASRGVKKKTNFEQLRAIIQIRYYLFPNHSQES